MKIQHYVLMAGLLVLGYYIGIKYPNFWQGITGA